MGVCAPPTPPHTQHHPVGTGVPPLASPCGCLHPPSPPQQHPPREILHPSAGGWQEQDEWDMGPPRDRSPSRPRPVPPPPIIPAFLPPPAPPPPHAGLQKRKRSLRPSAPKCPAAPKPPGPPGPKKMALLPPRSRGPHRDPRSAPLPLGLLGRATSSSCCARAADRNRPT